jgi:arylsulfatase A-like enzyme
MNARGALGRAVLAAYLALAAACGQGGAARDGDGPRPRNVVLVLADTLRADRLGCYGYPLGLTPTIDALAARGTLYGFHYAQGGWTVPSTISSMSGLWVIGPETALPADQPTLAETLAAAGIATAAFLGNGVLSEQRGMDRGFAHFECSREPMANLVASFEQWWEGRGREASARRGLFAWFQPLDVHGPYESTEWSRTHVAERRPDAAALEARWRAAEAELAELAPDAPRRSSADALHAMSEANRLYDGSVAQLDAAIGELLGFLEREGELARTLVIVGSDHGEALYEHRQLPGMQANTLEKNRRMGVDVEMLFGVGHGAYFEDEVLRVPMVLAGPGMPAGVARGVLSGNVDLYPTICEALAVDAPERLHGRSLFGGAAPGHARLYASSDDAAALVELSQTGMQKLVRLPARRMGNESDDAPVSRLFDLDADPAERAPLAGTEDFARLARALEEFEREFARPIATHTTEEMRAELEALGYVEQEE